jgi:epoxyqueuosine reductase
VLLGSVLTDADLEPGRPMVRDCGTCSACLPACPTGALIAPGILDARRCLAYWLQAPGPIPRHLRPVVGDRLYGCDDCIEACPPGHRLLELGDESRGRTDLVRLLAATDDALLAEHARFFLPGRRPRYLRRNALVALGNTGGAQALEVAAGYAGHPDPLLRGHAAWALGRIGGGVATAALEAARAEEGDVWVKAEIDAALAPS